MQELGLRDPWVRNYVWVYSPRIFKTPWQMCKSCFFNRLPHGFAIAVLYTIGQSAFLKWYNENGYGEAHLFTCLQDPKNLASSISDPVWEYLNGGRDASPPGVIRFRCSGVSALLP
ncbi:unnamed protein product, partial [Hydatigera taeniaeformis]